MTVERPSHDAGTIKPLGYTVSSLFHCVVLSAVIVVTDSCETFALVCKAIVDILLYSQLNVCVSIPLCNKLYSTCYLQTGFFCI